MTSPGGLRSVSGLRAVARRLPVLRRYERRLVELQGRIAELESQGQAFQMFPPGHYYSAVPNLDDLSTRTDLFAFDPLDIPGVDLRVDDQWALLETLQRFAVDVPFPEARAAAFRFWFDNDSYAFGDATTLYSLLRLLRPSNVVEIGAGYSTACILDTIEGDELGTQLTVVEPHPDRVLELLKPGDRERVSIVTSPVEQLDASFVDHLGASDVLFIDSTHVAKTGSDVVYELHRLLPRLAPGVFVHFHDIFPGFEYPSPWVFEGRGWNEAYALRAFLEFNSAFRVELWPSLLRRLDRKRAETLMPALARNEGACLWLRRVQ